MRDLTQLNAGQWIKIGTGLPQNKGCFCTTDIHQYFGHTDIGCVYYATIALHIVADDLKWDRRAGTSWIQCTRLHFVRPIRDRQTKINHDFPENQFLSPDSTLVHSVQPITWPKLRFGLKNRKQDWEKQEKKDVYYARDIQSAIHNPETERVVADSRTGKGIGGWIIPKEQIGQILREMKKKGAPCSTV